MFRKLRIQFISVVMVSVAVVLGVVFTGICVAEHQKSVDEVNQALAEAINRAADDRAPRGSVDQPFSGEWRPDEFSGGVPEDAGYMFGGPRIGGNGEGRGRVVPVAVYTVSQDQSFSIVSSYATAQIDSDVLEDASSKMSALEDGTGTLADLGLHYEKRTTEVTTYVAFADTSYTSSWESLAFSLAIAGLGVLAVFFVISLFLSNWALKPVKEAWESQRQFVADASHELKTPLTVILANNSILMKHAQDTIASQSQWVESSQVEAENMQGLINEMLELAQVESRAAIRHDELDFSDLVDGITLQFESVAFERGCELIESVEPNISLSGDESRLRKAVSTLVENALKYVDHDGIVKVELTSASKRATLSISNTGSVISPEDLTHIFDRFYRTDKARTSGAGGYGLGLAIAREIIREHEGDITCSSSTSAGTTFTVTLPLTR